MADVKKLNNKCFRPVKKTGRFQNTWYCKLRYHYELYLTLDKNIIIPVQSLSRRQFREEVDKVSPKAAGIKQIAQNKKAYHDYYILEKFEAGVELFGTEVKSIRAGNISLKEAFCMVKNGELFAQGMRISPYEKGNIFNRDPMRPKRLLMHKREINRLYGRIKQDGLALIPLSVYFKDSRVKIELGLPRGKKLHDKRESDAEKSSQREMDRHMKSRIE